MDKEQLYKMLDLETGEDFQYFENFADLVESSEEIDNDLVYELLKDIDINAFGDLCENYFDEIETTIPEAEMEIFTLLTNIKRVIMGMAEAYMTDEAEDILIKLADEVNKFRIWYSEEGLVECKNQSTNEIVNVPVRDALLLSKLEKFDKDIYLYDFTEALDYELEEYMMTYADLIATE